MNSLGKHTVSALTIALAVITVIVCPCEGLDCSQAPYPDVCVSALSASPEAFEASSKDVANTALEASMGEVSKVSAFASGINQRAMDEVERIALQDCMELLDCTSDMLNASISGLQATKKATNGDLVTWLSACVTNQDTCLDGFQNSNGYVKSLMQSKVENVSKSVRNSLDMVKAVSSVNGAASQDVTDSTHSRRRLLTEISSFSTEIENGDGFPSWMPAADRKLLQAPHKAVQAANAVVAQDGSGNYKTITDAVNAAPEKSNSRYVIHVKAGTYRENVVVSKKKTNLMFIGDGMDVTVVSGSKSVGGGTTTFRSATFGVVGKGFIAQRMTFENTAGPGQHQAVALRVGSDLSALYQCSFKGYQDTLYTHSLRQFYRECNIYGTVDFIFGNGRSLYYKSELHSIAQVFGSIAAQNRLRPYERTGFVFLHCKVTGTGPLYLGRAMGQYSRIIYAYTYFDDIIAGWDDWDHQTSKDGYVDCILL